MTLWSVACVPALEDECSSPKDCEAGQHCVAGRCISSAEPDALPPDASPDAELDVSLPDATGDAKVEPDRAPPPDAAPPPDMRTDAACEIAEEVCDGVDNDCDTRIDEGAGGLPIAETCYPETRETLNVGVCRGGQRNCDPEAGAFGECFGHTPPTDEVCDGLDNDCDGAVDEGVTEACFGGAAQFDEVGECRRGLRRCEDGSLGECEGAVPPAVEICDTADNDCNGETDEIEGCECMGEEMQPCYSGAEGTEGVGPCVAGQQVCEQNAFGLCIGEVKPAPEQCNGLDDDCDAGIDEEVPVGGDCVVGQGACVREGQLICEFDADYGGVTLHCNVRPAVGMDERCDDIDNDCDGSTDEGLGKGEPCSEGLGPCRVEGVRECGPGGDVVCSAQPLPAEPFETCNEIDDDCDGAIDEGEGGEVLFEPCYTGDERTRGVGVCADGQRACGQRACQREVRPSAEICNGQDDDCNGVIDDRSTGDCECDPGDRVDCYEGENGTRNVGRCHDGERQCQDGGYGACLGATEPREERCDGVDDDCDTRIDEQVPAAGGACQAGVGACIRNGVDVCVSVTGEIECDAVPGTPTEEICDGADNDCDGEIDEVAGAGEPCEVGVGPCSREGTMGCEEGALRCSATAGAKGEEVCNGEDDDCDGIPDEGLLNACGACGPAPAEICDDIDQDCDDRIDEGLGLGRGCVIGEGECRAEGEKVCDGNGGVECDAEVLSPDREVCDGLDNDCDGNVDNEPSDVGEDCSTGVGACMRHGVIMCRHGNLRCSINPASPGNEVCNEIDDDCDGDVDEDVSNACGGCGPVPPEECNGDDDDCDGETDEGSFGECDADGDGICAVGVWRCDHGDRWCEPTEPTYESCNGLDDDCDGEADEAEERGESLCSADGALAQCEGRCVGWACRAGRYDTDNDPSNGCPRGCTEKSEGIVLSDDDGPARDVAIATNGAWLAYAWISFDNALHLEGDDLLDFNLPGYESVAMVATLSGGLVVAARQAAGGGIDVYEIDEQGGFAPDGQTYGNNTGPPTLVAKEEAGQATVALVYVDSFPGGRSVFAASIQGPGAQLGVAARLGADDDYMRGHRPAAVFYSNGSLRVLGAYAVIDPNGLGENDNAFAGLRLVGPGLNMPRSRAFQNFAVQGPVSMTVVGNTALYAISGQAGVRYGWLNDAGFTVNRVNADPHLQGDLLTTSKGAMLLGSALDEAARASFLSLSGSWQGGPTGFTNEGVQRVRAVRLAEETHGIWIDSEGSVRTGLLPCY